MWPFTAKKPKADNKLLVGKRFIAEWTDSGLQDPWAFFRYSYGTSGQFVYGNLVQLDCYEDTEENARIMLDFLDSQVSDGADSSLGAK